MKKINSEASQKNIFSRVFGGLSSLQGRRQLSQDINQNIILRFFTVRYVVGASLLFYGYYFFKFQRQSQASQYRFAMTRKMSQFTGFVMNMPLPPYLRVYIFKGFGALYGVNFDEIKVEDINQFRTFNQFFTRELKEGVRQIQNETDLKTMCSPVDGRVLSFGTVDTIKTTMDCIKGHDYRVDEFLFGVKDPKNIKDDPKLLSKVKQQTTVLDAIIQGADQRGNKIMYLVIYLAPGDYHRYHSPSHFIANYRRHIVGYLEPVMPKYLENHKDVLKENERVNLLGEWTHGLFAISFVGALNVGSIKVNFDEELKTNVKNPQLPYMIDKNYSTLQASQNLLTIPQRNKLAQQSDATQSLDKSDDLYSIAKYLNEFDIKDIVDISKKETTFQYSVQKEGELQYNLLNGFKEKSGMVAQDQETKELLSKLEISNNNPLQTAKKYTITPNGVVLRKGEEIGMFEMGSTVAMIFECPQDYELNLKSGEKVILGQEILSQRVDTPSSDVGSATPNTP
eukprot:403355758